MRCPLRMSMRPNLLLLIGTLGPTALINHAMRIKTSPRRRSPSPRLLTHTKTPHIRQQTNKSTTQCTPMQRRHPNWPPHIQNVPPQKGRHANF